MNNFLKFLLPSVFVAWVLFVMINYFHFHPEYLKAFFNSSGLFFNFFITFLLLFGGIYLYQKFYLDKKIEFKRTPLLYILFGFLGVGVIGSLEFLIMQDRLGLNGYFLSIGSMFGHLIPVLITLIGVFILSFVLGDKLINLLGLTKNVGAIPCVRPDLFNDTNSDLFKNNGIISIIFGLSIILLGLFFLGLFGILNKIGVLGFGILIIVFCIFNSPGTQNNKTVPGPFGNFWNWLIGKNLEKKEFNFLSLELFLYIALFFLISVNIFDIIRPMPIGWDDMGVYLNMPKRIAEDASILAGQGGQAWMLMTSLGFILWEGYVGTTVSMFLNFFGGLLGVVALFVFIKHFFKEKLGDKNSSLMALFGATFYYFMPMITFQSALDMKMDPILFLFMVGSAILLFDPGVASKKEGVADKFNRSYYLTPGSIKLMIGGFILATAFFIKITTAMEIFAIGAVLSFFIFNWKTAVGVIFLETSIFLLGFAQIPEFSPEFTKILAVIFGILGIFFILISKIKKMQFIKFAQIFTSIGVGFLFIALPWATFNYSSSQTLSMGGLVNGKFLEKPDMDFEKLGIDVDGKDKLFCTSTASKEEKGRYIGYDQPFFQKYFTLAWKNTMNTQIHGYYLDIGFLFLALLPGLFLLGIWRRFGKMEWGIIILFSVNWFFWTFAAHGIPWYGLFGFLPAIVLLSIVLFDKNYGVETKNIKDEVNFFKLFFIFLIIILISAFGYLRETKTFSHSTASYAFGKIDGDKYIDGIIPTYRQTVDFIDGYRRTEEDPGYLFRVGTFIPFFVKDVRRNMVTDSQLDKFRCIDGDGKNDARTFKRLKDLGFRFFILDTNTYTIEKDINGTLHQKYKRFVDFANKNLEIIYYKPKNGISFMILR